MDPDNATDRIIARALTFKERRQLFRGGALAGTLPCDQDRAQRLRRWMFWMTLEGADPTGWRKFLSKHGVAEHELLAMANARLVKSPRYRWIRTLKALLSYLSRDDARLFSSPHLAESLALPAVRYAWGELRRVHGQRLGKLLHPRAAAALRATLRSHLAQSAAWVVLDVQWLVAETSLHPEIIPGPSAASKTSDYGSPADRPDLQTLRLLNGYPALARLWANQIDHWLEFTSDFLRDVEHFAGHACPPVSKTGPVVRRIKPELSDRHDGGRAVLEVRLANGQHRFYKPRSGEHEKGWFGLLRWINDEGFSAPFQIVDVWSGRNTCWMAAVPRRACRTHTEVEQAYFRAGSLLCLVYLLGGVDIHAQNLVVNGSQPVIVDPETLFHPDPPRQVAGRQPSWSVLRTGMLPITANLASGQDSVSALGRRTSGSHSVRLRTQIVPVAQYAPAIVEGFRAIQDFLGRSPDQLRRFDQTVQELKKLCWRRILRPTSHYQAMLEKSLSPSLLRDGMERSLYLYAACGLEERPHSQRRVEAACLEQGDIPRFYRRTNGSLPRQRTELEGSASTILAALGGVAEPTVRNLSIRVPEG